MHFSLSLSYLAPALGKKQDLVKVLTLVDKGFTHPSTLHTGLFDNGAVCTERYCLRV